MGIENIFDRTAFPISRRPSILEAVQWSELVSASSSSHASGTDTRSPGRALTDQIEAGVSLRVVHGRLRDECLNTHEFESLEQARRIIEAWRRDYNDHRPQC